MDLSVLAKDAVSHVCSKKGHFSKDCWYQTNKGGGKGKDRSRKGHQNPEMATPRIEALVKAVIRLDTLLVNV